MLDRWALRRNLLVGLVGAGIGLAVFAWSRWLPLTIAMGVLSGYGLILYVASTNTLIQMTVEDRYRGRVMSLYTLFFVGTSPFGALLAGGIAQRFGAPVATSVCALVLLGGALWVSVRLREIAAREAAELTRVAEPDPAGSPAGAVQRGAFTRSAWRVAPCRECASRPRKPSHTTPLRDSRGRTGAEWKSVRANATRSEARAHSGHRYGALGAMVHRGTPSFAIADGTRMAVH